MRDTWFIAARTLLFTILVPCAVLVVVPYSFISSETPDERTDFSAFRYLGLPAIVAGAMMYVWCAWHFTVRGRGTPAPIDAPKKLDISGPYRYSRNPMYTGVLTEGLGVSIFFESVETLAFVAIMAAVFVAFVLGYEELALRAKFGADYEAYCKKVPRFFPRLLRRGHVDAI